MFYYHRLTLTIILLATILGVTAMLFAMRLQKTQPPFQSFSPSTIRYIPLGDSFTIGTSTARDKAWPVVVTRQLQAEGVAIELVDNPAVSGYTSKDVLAYQLERFKRGQPTFTTLWVGTNDTATRNTLQEFEIQLLELVEKTQAILPDPKMMVLLTIPDYTKLPVGQRLVDVETIRQKIEAFNRVIVGVAKEKNIPVIDMFDQVEGMTMENGLITPDGLHPTVQGHEKWAKVIYPSIKQLLE